MRLALVFLLVFLMLLASTYSILDLQEHNNTEETEALSENSRLHITAVSKKGGGGGGHGGGGGGRGGGGRGGRGGRGAGAFYGAAGAAGVAGAAGAGSHHHKNRSSSATAQLGLTLPSVLLGLGVYFIQF